MPIAAVAAIATAGATVYSANKASKGAKAATAAQTQSNNDAIAQQREASARAEALSAPWRQVGMQALGEMARLNGIQLPPDLAAQLGVTPAEAADRYGGFEKSPGYQFRMDEGKRAITGNAAARGLIDSGTLGKGLIKYGQDYASNEFGAHYNRIAGVADQGRAAAGTASGIITNTANNIGNLTTAQGVNAATGAATQAGIQAGLISNLGGIGAGLIREYGNRTPTTYGGAYDYNGMGGLTGIGPNGQTAPPSLWGPIY